MSDQRAVLKLLNENPVTETAPWLAGEPNVQDVLRDPVVHAVLRRDGLSLHDLMRVIARERKRLWPAASRPPGPDATLPAAALDSGIPMAAASDAA